MSNKKDKNLKRANPLDSFKPNTILQKQLSKTFEVDSEGNFFPAKLMELKDINEFTEAEQNVLYFFYKHEDPDMRKFGTVINALITQLNMTFTVAVSDLSNLLRMDPHHSFHGVDGDYYKKIFAKALSRNYLEMLRPAVTKGKRKTAIYKVKIPALYDLLIVKKGTELAKAEEQAILDWYDEKVSKQTEAIKQEVEASLSKEKMDKLNELMSQARAETDGHYGKRH